MPEAISNNQRIAKNTLMLYGRMLLGMIVSLYTSRVILAMLGEVDFGINEVVGGLVGMFSIISGSLSASAGRFLTFELGKGDRDSLVKTFSTAVIIHLGLAVLVILLLETLGLWFLNHKMNIGDDRMYAANWVFQTSIISFVVSLLSVPYNASIVAHEKMGAFAAIGLFEIFAKLLIVLFVAYGKHGHDNLILFSSLQLCICVIIRCLYTIYCKKHFTECRQRIIFDQKYLKQMTSFAGWNFIGASASVLRGQGGSILINIFHGATANAANGIATSVNRAVSAFAGNFMAALNPQITKSFANGEKEYMFSLVGRGARFSFYLLWILSFPILMNTYSILDIWLKDVPERATLFVQLILVNTMCEALSSPLITAMLATGDIKKYQLIVGGLQLLNLPISYICLYLGAIPETIMIVTIALNITCLFARMILLREMIDLDIKWYVKNVLFNTLYVIVVSIPIPLLISNRFKEGDFLMLVISCLICVICSSLSAFIVGCTRNERKAIFAKGKEMAAKIFR